MPSSTGPCCCSTERPILPRPSARSVPRWRSLCPIWLRTWVIRTFATLRVVLLLAREAALRLLLGGGLGRSGSLLDRGGGCLLGGRSLDLRGRRLLLGLRRGALLRLRLHDRSCLDDRRFLHDLGRRCDDGGHRGGCLLELGLG